MINWPAMYTVVSTECVPILTHIYCVSAKLEHGGIHAGAGGGGMWMTETGEQRISQVLFDQVMEKKPEMLATACPYCLTMLEDEAREKALQNSLAVMDIAEIIQSALPDKTR